MAFPYNESGLLWVKNLKLLTPRIMPSLGAIYPHA